MTLNRGNKLFEGSRMVLPEHRKRIRDQSWERNNLTDPPILDEQQLEDLQYTVMTAMEENRKVEVFYYIDRQQFSRLGFVLGVDPYAQVLKMQETDGMKAFVPLASISGIALRE